METFPNQNTYVYIYEIFNLDYNIFLRVRMADFLLNLKINILYSYEQTLEKRKGFLKKTIWMYAHLMTDVTVYLSYNNRRD
jgi:hypothetical protein